MCMDERYRDSQPASQPDRQRDREIETETETDKESQSKRVLRVLGVVILTQAFPFSVPILPSTVPQIPRLCSVLVPMSDSHWPRPPRLIAPASGPHQDDSTQIPFNPRHFSASQASSDDSSTALRKHKTTACETCKQKKLKVWFPPLFSHV